METKTRKKGFEPYMVRKIGVNLRGVADEALEKVLAKRRKTKPETKISDVVNDALIGLAERELKA